MGTLTVGPGHRDPPIRVHDRAGELRHRWGSPALGEIDLFAQFD
jgi:hypothetical protein